jgi:hypothetical protein
MRLELFVKFLLPVFRNYEILIVNPKDTSIPPIPIKFENQNEMLDRTMELWVKGTYNKETFKCFDTASLFGREEIAKELFDTIKDIGLYDRHLTKRQNLSELFRLNFSQKIGAFGDYETTIKKILGFCNTYGIPGKGAIMPGQSIPGYCTFFSGQGSKDCLEYINQEIERIYQYVINDMILKEKDEFWGLMTPNPYKYISCPLEDVIDDIFEMDMLINEYITVKEPNEKIDFNDLNKSIKDFEINIFARSKPKKERTQLMLTLNSLKEAVSAIILNSVVGNTGFARCKNEYCGNVFYQKSNSNTYCSPECSGRYRRRKSYWDKKDNRNEKNDIKL